MKNQLRETFKIVKKPEYRIYWAIVAICGFVFALGLSLALRRYFHFEFHDRSGIVGWVSVNKYPKQQEMFYYIAAFVFMPMFTAFCWFLWMVYSAATALLTQSSVRRMLKQSAFSYIPLLFALKDLFRLELSVAQLLWIPLGLVVIAKVGLLCYNFLCSKPPKDDGKQQPKYTIEQSSNLPTRLLINAAGTVLTAGLCIGFYALIVYPPSSSTLWNNLKILLITTFIVLAFWCAYSFFINRIRHRRFQHALADDAYAYVPAVLLLATSVFYPSGRHFLLILFALGFAGVKVFAISAPQRLDKLHSSRLAWRLLSYLMIPALFYVFLYGKGSVHGGLDLFHEGERLAPLNELLHGGIPFRDIYIQHGLFQNAYRPLLASKLFGGTLASVRFLEGLFGPLGYVCVYLLGLQVFKSRLSAILIVFIVSGQDFGVSDRHSIFLVNVALLANYITTQHDRGLFAGWRPISPLPSCSLRSPTASPYGREIVASCIAFGWKLILAGIVTSLAFFYSTEMGVYAFITCGLFLFLLGFTKKGVSGRKRPLPLFCYLAGVFLGALPFVVYFGLHGAIDDLVYNSYIQLVYQIPTWGLQFPPVSSFLSQFNAEGLESFTTETFRWYLPVLLCLIATTYLLHRVLQRVFWSAESNAKLLLLLLAGITLFRTALGRSDSPHLVYGATMMWFIWIFFLERSILWIWHRPEMFASLTNDFVLWAKWQNGKVAILNCALATLPPRQRHIPKIIMKSVCVLIPSVIFLWYISTVHHPVRVFKDRLISLTQYQSIPRNVPQTLEGAGGIQLPADQVSQLQQVVKYIQSNTSENDTIFDFSSQGAYYFFANRKSATRYHQIAYAATKSMQEEVIHDLDKSQTKLAILGTGGWFDNIDGVPSTDRHPLIAQYLEEHYQEAVNINGTIILRRRKY
ncbi:hypothetical protein H8E77_12075 [bacterium]|nr:hypothetical protein [bacterium]